MRPQRAPAVLLAILLPALFPSALHSQAPIPPPTLEPLATLSATVTEMTVYGETPQGLRVDVSFEGRLRGRIQGTMRGVDYTRIRGDGVLEIDVRASILTDDGARISAEIHGNLIDGRIRDTSVTLLTGHPAYQWLHDRILVGRGWTDGTQLHVQYFIAR